jgi:hypothetical protein
LFITGAAATSTGFYQWITLKSQEVFQVYLRTPSLTYKYVIGLKALQLSVLFTCNTCRGYVMSNEMTVNDELGGNMR